MLLHKNFNVQIKGVDDEKYIITGVFSTDDEDRHGEIVDQKTWILDAYLRNPVILFGHDHNQPAIGKCISLYFNNDGNLEGQIQFAVEEYDFAKTIYQLLKGGYMRAFSVGFQNEVYEVDQEEEKITLKRNHLFEISVVNVPANAMALAKSKGIDTEPIEKFQKSHNMHNVVERMIAEASQKEGRVLSAKNRTAVENAISALSQVLEADTGKSITFTISDDTPAEPVKVETPTRKGVNIARVINKASRALLATKRELTN